MSDFFPQSLSHKVKDSYPQVVCVVAYTTYRTLGRKARCVVFLEDILSDCFLFYLETKKRHQEKLATFDKEREFAYIYKTLIGLMKGKMRTHRHSQKIEQVIMSDDDSHDVLDISEKLNVKEDWYNTLLAKLETQEAVDEVNILSRCLIGKDIDEESLGAFLKQMIKHKTLIEKVERRLKLSPDVSDEKRQPAFSFDIDENDNIQTRNHMGLVTGNCFKNNAYSLSGYLRKAVEEEGLLTTEDIKKYLAEQGVFYRSNRINDYISRTFKALGKERPKQGLSKKQKLNECIESKILENKTNSEIMRLLRQEVFDTSQILDLSTYISSRRHAVKIKQEKKAKGFIWIKIPENILVRGEKRKALTCVVKMALSSREVQSLFRDRLELYRLEKLVQEAPFKPQAKKNLLSVLDDTHTLIRGYNREAINTCHQKK